ncbi:hypothetical protein CEXT_733561 [Caerostris extrusa]|uniref:Uncharacterized protein n=1 Tax=Caerostris extrusa TaxID=172846 RepID=A0AAV4U1N9_CAEEX|nr:hypothetical protein CEXT_733561 [Caerostris extrusa]
MARSKIQQASSEIQISFGAHFEVPLTLKQPLIKISTPWLTKRVFEKCTTLAGVSGFRRSRRKCSEMSKAFVLFSRSFGISRKPQFSFQYSVGLDSL